MRSCIKCGIQKDLEEFNKWYKPSGASGKRTICKSCERGYNKTYRKLHMEKLKIDRAIRNGSSPRKRSEDPKTMKMTDAIYRSRRKYPEKDIARRIFWKNLKLGNITRSSRCEMCNKETNVEGHHNNYDRPLEVLWVCRRCHCKIHTKEKP